MFVGKSGPAEVDFAAQDFEGNTVSWITTRPRRTMALSKSTRLTGCSITAHSKSNDNSDRTAFNRNSLNAVFVFQERKGNVWTTSCISP